MYFQHATALWRDFPALVPGVLYADGITAHAAPGTDHYTGAARARLADGPESEFPEIQAWRRAFARMGLKPTQYRCAAESLLRRFRKEGSLPPLHPLVDLCNAVSLAFAVPVAVLDADQVAWPLEVRYAAGDEDYLTFGGEVEHPAPGEVIFADQAGQAHARRWTNRQSGRSAVSPATSTVLIVAEALHEGAATTIAELIDTLTTEIAKTWTRAAAPPQTAILTPAAPRFTWRTLSPAAGTPAPPAARTRPPGPPGAGPPAPGTGQQRPSRAGTRR
jgi:DNA/RNA-binding domain of Phe-tRNA-synthetase-like protein